jgi:hypothetical protein
LKKQKTSKNKQKTSKNKQKTRKILIENRDPPEFSKAQGNDRKIRVGLIVKF